MTGMSTDWPGFRSCSVKQKHWILLNQPAVRLCDQRRAGEPGRLAEGLVERHSGVGHAEHAGGYQHEGPGDTGVLVHQPLPPMRTMVRPKKMTATASRKKNMNRFLPRCWRWRSVSPGRRSSSAMTLIPAAG